MRDVEIMSNKVAKFLAILTLSSSAFVLSAHADDAAFLGDAKAGEKIFKKCAACHKIGDDAKNSVGPVLTNVYGRTTGTFEGYKYGKGLKAAGENGHVWEAETLFGYLENPKKYIRGYLDDKKAKVKMTLKLKKEKDRKNVIAYLKSLSDN